MRYLYTLVLVLLLGLLNPALGHGGKSSGSAAQLNKSDEWLGTYQNMGSGGGSQPDLRHATIIKLVIERQNGSLRMHVWYYGLPDDVDWGWAPAKEYQTEGGLGMTRWAATIHHGGQDAFVAVIPNNGSPPQMHDIKVVSYTTFERNDAKHQDFASEEYMKSSTAITTAPTPAEPTPLPQPTPAQPHITVTDEGSNKRLTIGSDLLFDFDKYALNQSAEKILAEMGPMILKYGPHPISVEGHTDSIGADDYNQLLSERRANSVKDWLASHGFVQESVTAVGLGKTKPVSAEKHPDGTDFPEGRQRNRRVEVIISTSFVIQ